MTKEELLIEIGKQVPYFNNYTSVRDAVDAYTEALLKQCNVSSSFPSVDEAGIVAVKISEMVEPKLTAQEQSFFIAGFCECVKWLGSNDR